MFIKRGYFLSFFGLVPVLALWLVSSVFAAQLERPGSAIAPSLAEDIQAAQKSAPVRPGHPFGFLKSWALGVRSMFSPAAAEQATPALVHDAEHADLPVSPTVPSAEHAKFPVLPPPRHTALSAGVNALDDPVAAHFDLVKVGDLIEYLAPAKWQIHFDLDDSLLEQSVVFHAETDRRKALDSLLSHVGLQGIFYSRSRMILITQGGEQ